MSTHGIDYAEVVKSLYEPFKDELDLWCHRTRVTEAETFWTGLEVPRLQQGIESTATLILSPIVQIDPGIDLDLYTSVIRTEDPTSNARVFIVAPKNISEYLEPLETSARFQRKGLLPGNFVLAHLKLLPPAVLTRNPLYEPK